MLPVALAHVRLDAKPCFRLRQDLAQILLKTKWTLIAEPLAIIMATFSTPTQVPSTLLSPSLSTPHSSYYALNCRMKFSVVVFVPFQGADGSIPLPAGSKVHITWQDDKNEWLCKLAHDPDSENCALQCSDGECNGVSGYFPANH